MHPITNIKPHASSQQSRQECSTLRNSLLFANLVCSFSSATAGDSPQLVPNSQRTAVCHIRRKIAGSSDKSSGGSRERITVASALRQRSSAHSYQMNLIRALSLSTARMLQPAVWWVRLHSTFKSILHLGLPAQRWGSGYVDRRAPLRLQKLHGRCKCCFADTSPASTEQVGQREPRSSRLRCC
jgi:hypothetical protein